MYRLYYELYLKCNIYHYNVGKHSNESNYKNMLCLDCSAKEVFHGCILKTKTLFIRKLINTHSFELIRI